jgi:hypothetical protein
MEHSSARIIKNKLGLLNLAAELGNLSSVTDKGVAGLVVGFSSPMNIGSAGEQLADLANRG